MFGLDPDILNWVLTPFLFAGLITLALIDIQTLRLPDTLTLPLLVMGLIAAVLEPLDWVWHASGALAGYLLFVGIEVLYQRLRNRPGLGRGDAKLLAAGGAWCGIMSIPMMVLLASTTALITLLIARGLGHSITRETPVPFGPFIAAGIAMIWLSQRVTGWPLSGL